MGSDEKIRIYHFDTEVSFFQYLQRWRVVGGHLGEASLSPATDLCGSLYNVMGGWDSETEIYFNPLLSNYYPVVTEREGGPYLEYRRGCRRVGPFRGQEWTGERVIRSFFGPVATCGDWARLSRYEWEQVQSVLEEALARWPGSCFGADEERISVWLLLLVFRCLWSYHDFGRKVLKKLGEKDGLRWRVQCHYRGLAEYIALSVRHWRSALNLWKEDEFWRGGEGAWGQESEVREFFHIFSFGETGEAWFFGPGSYAHLPLWFLKAGYLYFLFAFDGQLCRECLLRGAKWGWRRSLETAETPYALRRLAWSSFFPLTTIGHFCPECLSLAVPASSRYGQFRRRGSLSPGLVCSECGHAMYEREDKVCRICRWLGVGGQSRAEWWEELSGVRDFRRRVRRAGARAVCGWRFSNGFSREECDRVGNYMMHLFRVRGGLGGGERIEEYVVGRLARLFVPLGRSGDRYYYAAFGGQDGYGLITVGEGCAKVFAYDVSPIRGGGISWVKRGFGALNAEEVGRFCEAVRRLGKIE